MKEKEPQKQKTPVIYIANHPNKEDKIYIMWTLKKPHLCTPSRGCELKIPLASRISRMTGNFPAEKGHTFFACMEKLILDQESILLFPQGKTTTDRNAPIHKGALELALQTGYPIVPLFIRGKWDVVIGKPFRPYLYDDVMSNVWRLEGGENV